MFIISKNGYPHSIEFQSHRTECWIPGFVLVPTQLEKDVFFSDGYCDLTIKNDVLVNVTPKDKPAPIPTPPTEQEQLRADVDYLAVMTGVEL